MFKKVFVVLVLVYSILFYGCSSVSYKDRYQKDSCGIPISSNDNEFIDDVPETNTDEVIVGRNSVTNPLRYKPTRKEKEKNNLSITSVDKLNLYLGTKYKFGGNDAINAIDCSAFTKSVYEDIFKIKLPRTAAEQYNFTKRIEKDELQPWDLVFFNTRRGVRVGHVGIYLGDDEFIHASSGRGVIKSSLNEAYYQKTYIGAGRVAENLHLQ